MHYVNSLLFGRAFFLLNLPFYYLAVKRMGWTFAIRTFCAVTLVALFFDMARLFYTVSHRSSVGGAHILTLYLQDKYNISAGKLQMAIDLLIVLLSFFVLNHRKGRYVSV